MISSEELRSLVACLSTVLSELESRVLSLYLDGYSYTAIGEKLGCDCKTVDNALQRVKRKVGAHLALARRPAVDRCILAHAHLAHHRPRRPRRCSPSAACIAAHAAAGARTRPAFERALAQVNRDLAAAAAERPRLGPRARSRPPRAASTPSSAAPSPPSSRSSRCIDRPGTEEDQRGLPRARPSGRRATTLMLGRPRRRRVEARRSSGRPPRRRGGGARRPRRSRSPRRSRRTTCSASTSSGPMLPSREHRVAQPVHQARPVVRADQHDREVADLAPSGAASRPRTARRASRTRPGRPRTRSRSGRT